MIHTFTWQLNVFCFFAPSTRDKAKLKGQRKQEEKVKSFPSCTFSLRNYLVEVPKQRTPAKPFGIDDYLSIPLKTIVKWLNPRLSSYCSVMHQSLCFCLSLLVTLISLLFKRTLMIYFHQMTVQVKELKNEDYKDWSQEVGFFFYLFLSLDENRKRIEAYSCLVFWCAVATSSVMLRLAALIFIWWVTTQSGISLCDKFKKDISHCLSLFSPRLSSISCCGCR